MPLLIRSENSFSEASVQVKGSTQSGGRDGVVVTVLGDGCGGKRSGIYLKRGKSASSDDIVTGSWANSRYLCAGAFPRVRKDTWCGYNPGRSFNFLSL
jgi:hypothetical protein